MHPIALIRAAVEATQKEFSSLIGVGHGYLRKIEANLKPLTPELAGVIFRQFGAWVALDGLTPPLAVGPDEAGFWRWHRYHQLMAMKATETVDTTQEPEPDVIHSCFDENGKVLFRDYPVTIDRMLESLMEDCDDVFTPPTRPPVYDRVGFDWWQSKCKACGKADKENTRQWGRILLAAAEKKGVRAAVRERIGQALRQIAEDFQLSEELTDALACYVQITDSPWKQLGDRGGAKSTLESFITDWNPEENIRWRKQRK